ncbi:MAG: GSCFA domain-containing protein [Candidatus Amulumruptor caecigallinarius]|nr:GSCFA domain-containing protein [Candidatus Amulumruptor caecigallinarius]MCM1397315.1 GSCFA domain-containing protein [Candidatus Amulumruptor caecigallinarius]MCM1453620.1 GSCFA domain-containing protein [bacterium]
MKLRTEIEPAESPVKVTFDRPVFMAGSCFTTNIGAKLREHGFEVCVNPTGNVYNPASLAYMLERVASGRYYTAGELFEHEGLWHSFDHHTSFSDPDRECALATMNEALERGRDALSRASHVILTLGTAMVWRLWGSGRVVSNCHKLHADKFSRERLTVDECEGALWKCFNAIKEVNSDAQIIFTVSPIRHAADGLHGNQLSKATLLLAVDNLVATDGDSYNSDYFPAYEMLIDDLRDYRFYASDLTHPSEVAIEYVWEQFCRTFLSPSTLEEGRRRRKQILRSAHRPLTTSSAATAPQNS